MKLFRLRVCLALACLLAGPFAARTPTAERPASDEEQIRAVLDAQVAAWNRDDVDAFMQGYWKSDKTEFVGASGVFRGWQAVLDRYRKAYPDRQAMGHLTFSNLEVTMLGSSAALVLGDWELERAHDHPGGVFTLVFRRFPEGWRIIHDHTSVVTGQASPQ